MPSKSSIIFSPFPIRVNPHHAFPLPPSPFPILILSDKSVSVREVVGVGGRDRFFFLVYLELTLGDIL